MHVCLLFTFGDGGGGGVGDFGLGGGTSSTPFVSLNASFAVTAINILQVLKSLSIADVQNIFSIKIPRCK